MTDRRTTLRLTAATATAAAVVLTPAVSAHAATHHVTHRAHTSVACHTAWGITGKGVNLRSTQTRTTSVSVRTGRHACYDRVVFDLNGPVGAVAAAYPKKATKPSILAILSSTGLFPNAAKPGAALKLGYPAIKGIANAGTAKKIHGAAIVTTSRLPFRVFVIKGRHHHNRLVIDIAHHA